MGTCRVCKQDGAEIKYGVRHYAHAECALEKWGGAFFKRLTPWQASMFPYFAAKRANVLTELEARIKEKA